MTLNLAGVFPPYEKHDPLVSVYCVTPRSGKVIHRFFDTSPFSPQGRYLALFRMPREDRVVRPGERGDIVLVDLITGDESVVATTCGFEQQMGANINWGENDRQILFNDVDPKTWQPYGVRLDWTTGERKRLDHGVYHASGDGREVCTGNPATKRRTQPGYGVMVPDDALATCDILSQQQGLFVTDTTTGQGRLLLSMREIFETCFDGRYLDAHRDGECYLFHSKYSPSGQKIMFTTRWFSARHHGHPDPNGAGLIRFNVFTCNRDGSDLRLVVGQEHWQQGGHHTTWHPDEQHLTMNLRKDWDRMQFAKARLDDGHIERVLPQVQGTGHPSFHSDGFILTDTYFREYIDYGDDTVPIRLIHLANGQEEILARIPTQTPQEKKHPVLRIDPHPAFDRTGRYVAVNARIGQTRKVLVMDLSDYITTGK